jgi:NTE family protein
MAPPPIALVLAGGGARGAYEAGVIRYLREELPAPARARVRFDILCGTSVGAITACFLASTMDQPEAQGRGLASLWGELSLEQVYKVEGEDLFTLGRKMWRAATSEDVPRRPEGWRLYDILHPEPLEEMVRTRASWPRISANLARGLFSAISVSATQIATGRTVVFVQRREGGVPAWSRDPFVEAREAILGPEHALASAAIPLLFRSVKIGDEYFCDGSLRQNTPLSPALRRRGC